MGLKGADENESLEMEGASNSSATESCCESDVKSSMACK